MAFKMNLEMLAERNLYKRDVSVDTDPHVKQSLSFAEEPVMDKKCSRAKNLRSVPEAYFEAHAYLKHVNKTSLDFSAYIIESLREKLERDGALKKINNHQ